MGLRRGIFYAILVMVVCSLAVASGTKPIIGTGSASLRSETISPERANLVRRLEIANRQYQESLEHLVAERTEKLKNALEGIIEAMVKAVELRDPYTAGHQTRVAALAAAIAAEKARNQTQRGSVLSITSPARNGPAAVAITQAKLNVAI